MQNPCVRSNVPIVSTRVIFVTVMIPWLIKHRTRIQKTRVQSSEESVLFVSCFNVEWWGFRVKVWTYFFFWRIYRYQSLSGLSNMVLQFNFHIYIYIWCFQFLKQKISDGASPYETRVIDFNVEQYVVRTASAYTNYFEPTDRASQTNIDWTKSEMTGQKMMPVALLRQCLIKRFFF